MRNHLTSVSKSLLALLVAAGATSISTNAYATSGGELYTAASYSYGRYEARVQFAGGDGVVSSFFLWKSGSEMSDIYWNELDLETVWADCELKTNALYGLPEANNTGSSGTDGGWCTGFHTYAMEWTPDYIAWFVDGEELRRETGADSEAFRDNAAEDGMQIHFNTWPGDETFGGNFSEAILPIHEYINWVQFSSYADGQFTLEWREDFSSSTIPDGWETGTWDSPKSLSTHMPENVNFANGYAIISLTTDDALGVAGATPMDPEGPGPIDEPMDIPASGGSNGGGTTDSGDTSGSTDSGTGGNGTTTGDSGGDGDGNGAGASSGVGTGGTGSGTTTSTGDGTSGSTDPNAQSGGGGCSVGHFNQQTNWSLLGLALALGAALGIRRQGGRGRNASLRSL